jgi:hypothetical protein
MHLEGPATTESGKRTAIMQPYFFPYIGYFQLINSVDLLIVYDNIKYTKKGWINRNRILLNGKDATISLPIKSDSDFLDVRERELAPDFNPDKLINQLGGAYRRAPYFTQVFPMIEGILRQEESNLFKFLYRSIIVICERLGMTTKIRVSSDIAIDHSLKNQDKVLALCQAVNTEIYVNAIGGLELYSKSDFQARGIELKFIRSKAFVYSQFDNEFVPWLSIIDVLMFNSLDAIRECIHSNYELI